ncbi:hypothetical protein B0H13DRAFT_2284330 [Mycena leptocephala]|nr:hypothetical protein B0H13DRAFT_2284330 [Mycena leptocephala]
MPAPSAHASSLLTTMSIAFCDHGSEKCHSARWISAQIALEIRLRYMYKWRDMAGENVLNLARKIAPHSSIFARLHAVPPHRGPDLGVAAHTPLASVGDKTSPRSRPLRPRPALPIAVGARRAREVDDERHGAQDGGAVHPPWRADDAFSRCEPHTCCIAIGGDAKSDTLPAATATLVAAALKWERKTKETKTPKKKREHTGQAETTEEILLPLHAIALREYCSHRADVGRT